jgi:hypothetical protein
MARSAVIAERHLEFGILWFGSIDSNQFKRLCDHDIRIGH